jgi:hypothetical protein
VQSAQSVAGDRVNCVTFSAHPRLQFRGAAWGLSKYLLLWNQSSNLQVSFRVFFASTFAAGLPPDFWVFFVLPLDYCHAFNWLRGWCGLKMPFAVGFVKNRRFLSVSD